MIFDSFKKKISVLLRYIHRRCNERLCTPHPSGLARRASGHLYRTTQILTFYENITFKFSNYPSKLNLGCGFDILKGYLNIDKNAKHNPDLVADIGNLFMLPDGFYDEIVAKDILEHLPRIQTESVLKEWNRLLKIGGKLYLRLPNLLGVLELLKLDLKQSVEDQKLLVQCLFGTQIYEGDWHFTGFTPILINHYLMVAGFDISGFRTIDHWLLDIEAVKVSNVGTVLS
jgi:SAM-dependent methyltransferase